MIGATYETRGKVVRATSSNWVVDFGVPAFQNSAPPSLARPGILVGGRVYLGVDPFFYREELKGQRGMPNLIREWVLRRIFLETTPWNEATNASGEKVITRADVPRTFVEVRGTDAWNDDAGRAHYILECELE